MRSAKVREQAETTNGRHDTPRPSRLALAAFRFYLKGYLRRHFHSVCTSFSTPLQIAPETPLVVYGNHASWWDPMSALMLARAVFPGRDLYAPIDAAALEQYSILKRFGFFGVEQNNLKGAGQFIRTARRILERPNASLWLTPEGRFADPRDASAEFQPGLAHLAGSLKVGVFIPLAVEYPFWEERLPEVLTRFGEPITVEDYQHFSKAQWQDYLQTALRQTQKELANASTSRDSSKFTIVISGKSGVSGIYDWLRWAKARFIGGRFQKQHGEKLQ